MKRFFLTIFLIQVLISCRTEKQFKLRNFQTVEIETLMQDSLLNVRALEIYEKEQIGVFGTSNGKVGKFSLVDNNARIVAQLKKDSIVPNFRSAAITSQVILALSIASPSFLFKINGNSSKIVYQENDPKAFYDSMGFWNDQEGIAIGDPTEDCLSIIITRDGGNTWKKLSCEKLPKAKNGEAAFAASDTNIAIIGDHTWVATGGVSSRILYSPDKGNTWNVFDTPMVQGETTTGIFSIDFYDDKQGFAIGGDYTKPDDNQANKILTKDGGKTWELVAENMDPGYRSCVQYIPQRNAQELVAIGFKGIDFSNDGGYTWKHLSDEGFYTIRFLNDTIAYAAGQERLARLTFKE